ncbi:MAG: hypothetical protein U0232_21765 [Thermomicrobiales bacterium]
MPDLAIVRDRPYGAQIPTEADVLLVIEVSELPCATTGRPSWHSTPPLIPEVWIVNLRDARQIERPSTAPEGEVHAGRGRRARADPYLNCTAGTQRPGKGYLRWS